MNAPLLHKLRYISPRFFLWPLIAIIVLMASSCSDTGTLAAVEDARELADGNLGNGLFVHSLLQINETVYVGSKFVWQRNPSRDWSKTTLPSGLDPNETPVVSIATNGNDLFLTTSKYIYIRKKNNNWSSKTFSLAGSGTFGFNSLYAAGNEVLAVNSKNTVYRYIGSSDTWDTVAALKNTPIRGFAGSSTASSNKFFIAYRNKIKSGNDLDKLTDLSKLPNGKNNIQDIVYWSFGGKNYLGMVAADSKLYIYDIAANQWNEYKGGREFSNYENLSLAKIDDNLIVGRQRGGYQIFDLVQMKWKEDSYSKDGFTDNDSLVTLSSGVSITNLSLYKFLFYDDPNNNANDRIYAVPYSSNGVFGAKRKGSLWDWGLE